MLIGENVCLIPIDKEYLSIYQKWMNDPEITFYLNTYLPVTREQEQDWYENASRNVNEPVFSIRDNSTNKIIGNCSIRIIWKDRRGNLGIVIGEKDYWDKGLGTESLQLLLNYGFNALNLERIELEVFSKNLRALKCYDKVGFIEEGKKRKAIFYNGSYDDVIMMSILKDEWK